MLLMAQRRRVEELQSFTNDQVALLQSLISRAPSDNLISRAPSEATLDEEGVPPA